MFINVPWINYRYSTTYVWVPVGKKGHINTNINNIKMIFMVGFLRQRFYGIVEASSSGNLNSFIDLSSIQLSTRKRRLKIWKFIIVWDNALLQSLKKWRNLFTALS